MTNRKLRTAVASVDIVLIVLLAASLPSMAHTGFYPAVWPKNLDVEYVFDNNVPSGTPRAQVIDGAAAWNNRVDGKAPNFLPAGQATLSNPYTPCDGPNAVFWRDLTADGFPSDVIGYTPGCRNNGNFKGFTMIYDNNPPYPWYFGDDEVPDGRIDFESLTTHEWGHATGWYDHFGDDFCPDGSARQTMCPNYVFSAQRAWRSLEDHDVHTLVNAYE